MCKIHLLCQKIIICPGFAHKIKCIELKLHRVWTSLASRVKYEIYYYNLKKKLYTIILNCRNVIRIKLQEIFLFLFQLLLTPMKFHQIIQFISNFQNKTKARNDVNKKSLKFPFSRNIQNEHLHFHFFMVATFEFSSLHLVFVAQLAPNLY